MSTPLADSATTPRRRMWIRAYIRLADRFDRPTDDGGSWCRARHRRAAEGLRRRPPERAARPLGYPPARRAASESAAADPVTGGRWLAPDREREGRGVRRSVARVGGERQEPRRRRGGGEPSARGRCLGWRAPG